MIEKAIDELTKAVKENTRVNTELMFTLKEFGNTQTAVETVGEVSIETKTPAKTTKKTEKVVEISKEPEQLEKPETTSEPAGGEITEADLVELFKSMTAAHRKPVAELLATFGARKMSDIKADDLPKVYDQVQAIINEKEAA